MIRGILSILLPVLLALGSGSCATSGGKRTLAKHRNSIPQQTHHSFALMDDGEKIDADISRRGIKSRGLSDY